MKHFSKLVDGAPQNHRYPHCRTMAGKPVGAVGRAMEIFARELASMERNQELAHADPEYPSDPWFRLRESLVRRFERLYETVGDALRELDARMCAIEARLERDTPGKHCGAKHDRMARPRIPPKSQPADDDDEDDREDDDDDDDDDDDVEGEDDDFDAEFDAIAMRGLDASNAQ